MNLVQSKTLPELNGKAGQRSLPIADGQRPLLADVVERQVEQLQHRLIARKRAPVLSQLVQAHIHRLNSVGRLDDLADFRRVSF